MDIQPNPSGLINSPPSEANPSPLTVMPRVPNHSVRKPVLISTLIVLLVVAYGVYAKSAALWPFTSTQVPVVSESPIPSVSADPTADWKTYANTQYGFSVKLPPNWSEYVVQSGSELPRAEMSIRIKYNSTAQLPAQAFEFIVFTLAQWGEEQKIEQPHPIELGRSSAYVITTPFRYEFEGLPGESDIPAILATFKLTATDATVGWNTYTSKKEPGLSFKYPTDWKLETVNDPNGESVYVNAPKVGQQGTRIFWASDVNGLGGGCPPERPHIVINEFGPVPHATGFFVVSYGEAGVVGKDAMGVVRDVTSFGTPTRLGDTESCLYYPLFKSKIDATRNMWLMASPVQSQDRETTKRILESFTY